MTGKNYSYWAMSEFNLISSYMSRPLCPQEDISLFKGIAGDNLLLKDLFLLTNDGQYKGLLKRNVELILSRLDSIEKFYFSEGLCGIIYGLVTVSDIVDVPLDSMDGFTEVLQEYAKQRLSLCDYDVQSGLIGLGLINLALSKNRLTDADATIRICNLISSLLTEKDGFVCLPYKRERHPFFPQGTTWTNNGFLHGINSVLAFFLICIKEGVYNKSILDWAKRIAENQCAFIENTLGSFPMAYFSDDSGKLFLDSRLTKLHFCTGDFGIINNLCLFAEVFNSNDYWLAAQKAYLKVVRRLLAGESCTDHCFCHGKAGLVFFLERFRSLFYNESLAVIVSESKRQLVRSLSLRESDNGILNGKQGFIFALLGNRVNSSFERVLLIS